MQSLKEGSELRNGTYRIEKVLGQGGFGITYLAYDQNLERYVAIKEFFPKDFCDRDGATSQVTLGTQNTAELVSRLKTKFLKEARNIAKFNHPGIIKIHAAFEENNTAYYVMEYIEGRNLSEIVRSIGPLSEQRAIGYITKVGEALEYVHGHHINHLDVKPANIMVRKSDDQPILIDFGLSKQYDLEGNQTSTTPTGISHGYAPMEQYSDGGVKEFSPQTDLYSLAATLYYILSGVVPPQATKLIDEELIFPQTIPVNLMGPILKAMSVGRKSRHENIEKFLSEIKKTDTDPTTVILSSQLETEHKHQSKPKSIPIDPDSQHEPVNKKSKSWLIWGSIASCIIIILSFILFILPAKEEDNYPWVGYQYSKTVKKGWKEERNNNYAEAVKWYRDAAEKGDQWGQLNLGRMYATGTGVNQDYNEAGKWYMKSAQQGNHFAQFMVGNMYENGISVDQDYNQAANWYLKASEQGNEQAQCSLGKLYDKGFGVPQDYNIATKWYLKSAEQGNANAQYIVGLRYRYGYGVSKNLSEARIWFEKAAAQNISEAVVALEELNKK